MSFTSESSVAEMDRFRGVGLTLLTAGGASALALYLMMGQVPLIALLIGIAIVGASMFLTPDQVARSPRPVVFALNAFLDNVASLLESFRMASHNLFVLHDGSIYVYVSERPIPKAPEGPPESAVFESEGGLTFAFRSPVEGGVLSEHSDLCASIEEVLVDELDVADGVECIQVPKGAVIKVKGAIVGEPQRALKAFGGLYGLIAGSLAAGLMGRARVELMEASRDVRVLKVEGLD